MAINILKRIKHQIFNRLLLTSSLTIIVTVVVLIVVISNYYSDVIIKREMDLNIRTLERVEDYFAHKEADWNGFIRTLYEKGSLMDDISYALHNKDYLKYRLDKFTGHPSFIPSNIDTYFYGYFSQDEDVNAVSLNSEDFPDIRYLFIYNYGRWNQSVAPRSKEDSEIKYQNSGDISGDNMEDTFIKHIAINNPATLKKMGELAIYYSTAGLEKIVQRENVDVKSSFFLFGKDGQIVYANNQRIPKKFVENLPNANDDNKVKWDGKTYYVNSIKDIGEYAAFTVIPQQEMNKLTVVRGTMWLIIIPFITIAIIFTYSFMRNYSARIRQIDASIQEVQRGNLTIRIPETKKEDELATIASSFNAMLDELNEYIERVYVLNLKQNQAELKALQSQINPHFLFNTLEVIRMTAVVDGAKTSSKMIYHLSRLLRYSLESKEMVPLQVEIENVQQYLQLVQLQHPDRLTVHLEIPKEVENTSIQKLVLQPIVENYIVHGFQKDRKDNRLEIIAKRELDHIKIMIKDNGKGIPEERLKLILEHMSNEEGENMKSIGMKNVHQRLKLKHGKGYGLKVESSENVGTKITLVIPMGVDSNV
ncbi:sensor histidine kinase [Lederbergia sp. NSJ-179]|uniref:sensor histidine kinase n=1 Tax=Lederbergia sp. NSJ-179 TaxID=2931402 RepID=UPI001FD2F29F|nr:sensor histidine kinase [Lederbergia sp. NSJ-179]MCJ7843217.1 sensor histidine kinase [Lederbergia sp. NSJ-179]